MLQQHLQDTYQYLFDTAHRALGEGGSFAPFGAGIRKSGEQIHTNVDLAIEQSAPADHISGLIAGFRADDDEHGLIAAGLVFDGRASSDDATALCFHIEAANGKRGGSDRALPAQPATISPSTRRKYRTCSPRFSQT